ncbi:putative nuclease HARBI1 [Saccostrea cucullata]|uniref:putative nuclease HARBI1 n=1 Tax=Saccostrea cuccullata TaxID=36930 RepID=UPI002ECFEEA2
MAFQVIFQRLNKRNLRRERVFRDRTHPLDMYDDQDLIVRFRMPRYCILDIIDLLAEDLEPPTMRSKSIPASLQVLTALRYFATGSLQQVVADIAGVSQPTVSRIVYKTSKALSNRAREFIKFPERIAEQLVIKQGFSCEFNIPNVLGCVDGTLIQIKPPSEREDAYVCRKGYHAINVQGVCDHKKKLTNIVVQWPGSTHDAYVWNNCSLKEWFENQPYVGHLLGDQAYPLRQYLITPLRVPSTPADRAFNVAHKRARQRIEDTFGRWKSRWLCIHKFGGPLTVCLSTAVQVITATAVLHNICEDRGLPVEFQQDDDEQNDDDNDMPGDVQDHSGQEIRQMLIRDRF